jgi:hypothetical protein
VLLAGHDTTRYQLASLTRAVIVLDLRDPAATILVVDAVIVFI